MRKVLYPLKLKPLFKERIWGGRKLAEVFGCDLPAGAPIGEMWAAADHPNGMSLIQNGPFSGKTLGEILRQYPKELVGKDNEASRFPLMVKILDTGSNLSVQVHPDDTYASIHEKDMGKNEMWYIIQAGPDAEIIYGLKPGVTRAEFIRAIQSGSLEECLHKVKVKSGDVFYIPPGLVHAMGKDVLAAEVQQTSDITYRIYDYGRLDKNGSSRELHIHKALDVINYSSTYEQTTLTKPFECPMFRVDLLSVKNETIAYDLNGELEILLVLAGQGRIKSEEIKAGDAWILPTSLKIVNLTGNFKILRSRLGSSTN